VLHGGVYSIDGTQAAMGQLSTDIAPGHQVRQRSIGQGSIGQGSIGQGSIGQAAVGHLSTDIQPNHQVRGRSSLVLGLQRPHAL